MTNFDYLMQLNKLAGRSLNDLMQYPIFPFVLSQYNKNSLDLSTSTCYRSDNSCVCYFNYNTFYCSLLFSQCVGVVNNSDDTHACLNALYSSLNVLSLFLISVSQSTHILFASRI